MPTGTITSGGSRGNRRLGSFRNRRLAHPMSSRYNRVIMRNGTGPLRPFLLVMFVGSVVILLVVASLFLSASVGLGFTAGEVMVNPNARPDQKTQMEHAANLAFTFFAFVEIALAYVAVKSGLLQTRLPWFARAGGAFVAGSGLSYLIVVGTYWNGGPPRLIADLEHMLTTWIQNLV